MPLPRRIHVALACAALSIAASPAPSQLRPLPPTDWETFSHETEWSATGGLTAYAGHPLTLVQERGTLIGAGHLSVLWRSGRVAVQLSDATHWWFTPSSESARDPAGATQRRSAGDLRVGTIVCVLRDCGDRALGLHFGTRLPNADDRTGLGRDRTDFYALLGGRTAGRGVTLLGELGLGINGSRSTTLEQQDVLLFATESTYRAGPVTFLASVSGQQFWLNGWSARGNENLAEVRAGARVGASETVEIAVVRGLRSSGPRAGLEVLVGIRR